MSSVFIELYLDEDVDVLLSDLLRGRGFQAITTREAGCLGVSDDEQLSYASGHAKVLLTHNRVDFEQLAVQWFDQGREHGGIILARRQSPYEMARKLVLVLDRVSADEIRNQILYI